MRGAFRSGAIRKGTYKLKQLSSAPLECGAGLRCWTAVLAFDWVVNQQ